MPAKSEAQRKYLFATKGAAWVRRHGFDTKGKLPKRAPKAKLSAAARQRAKRKAMKA